MRVLVNIRHFMGMGMCRGVCSVDMCMGVRMRMFVGMYKAVMVMLVGMQMGMFVCML